MNVNGSAFHLLLSEADWGRCLVLADDRFGAWQRLANLWQAEHELSGSPAPTAPLTWDRSRALLRLQSRPIDFPAGAGEQPLSIELRRAADADRFGNIYWIDADRRRLRAWSAGSRRDSAFWPAVPVDCAAAHRPVNSVFVPDEPARPVERSFLALAVTEDHYLVAAFTAASSSGLLAFDLMAGGPPLEVACGGLSPFTPFDMARRGCGGVWLLDRINKRLWEFDRRLAVVGRPEPDRGAAAAVEASLFQAANGPPRPPVTVAAPAGIDLAQAFGSEIDPIALDALPGGGMLLLDRGAEGLPSRLFRLRRTDSGLAADGPVALAVKAHDVVIGQAAGVSESATSALLFVAPAAGHSVLAFDLGDEGQPFDLREVIEPFPLRRFGGRALITVRGRATYDSGAGAVTWAPIVRQPRARYRERAELITPVFDGRDPQCVWDRLMLDACIPSDARIEIAARAADERVDDATVPPGTGEAEALIGPWIEQPRAYLRGDGAELPWLRQQPLANAGAAIGAGTWELLLQRVRGRYLQLRLRLIGDGASSPHLRRLRAWYPRFSYPERFLPAVHREDPQAGDFLERMLANFEGINTGIEERIAVAQALFDVRTAPADTLAWLADWFDVALDPNWDELRRRLFLRHVMAFFRWHGTAHGLRMVLTLALAAGVDERDFADPDPTCTCPQGIRIIEAYLTRRIGRAAAGDPGVGEGVMLRAVPVTALWSPAEGNSGLVNRFSRWAAGRDASAAKQLAPFALFPPDDEAASWRAFCEANLGFVPTAGADERRRWQCFLRTRAVDPAALSARHGVIYAGFEAIDLPRDWPTRPALADDWQIFCAIKAASLPHGRWQDFLMRRYRQIKTLNRTHQTSWPSFDVVALPDHVPESAAAQADWLQFERDLLAMVRTAHRFSVLLPLTSVREDPSVTERRLALARRMIDLVKPAHTVFDVRFYWALNRLGEARLGFDTQLGDGSRAPELMPDAILGRAYLGASFVGGAQDLADGDRRCLAC